MPRNRRQPDRADALAYAVNRRKKLKGPRREFYAIFIDAMLDKPLKGFTLDASEGLCETCSEKTTQRRRPRTQ